MRKTVDLSAAAAIGSIATAYTPASGKRITLESMMIAVSGAVAVLFEKNTASAGNFVFRTPVLEANKPYTMNFIGEGLSLGVDDVLKMTGSGSANISGTLVIRED